jgi:hypothetical protein
MVWGNTFIAGTVVSHLLLELLNGKAGKGTHKIPGFGRPM